MIEVTLQEYPFANTWTVYVIDGDSIATNEGLEGDCSTILPQVKAQLSETLLITTTDTNACCEGKPVPGDDCSGSQWVYETFQEN